MWALDQRLYDLPERVIPRQYLDAPIPSEDEFVRGYALRAVRSRGALTDAGIAEHCRLPGGAGGMRPIVDGLAEDGLVRLPCVPHTALQQRLFPSVARQRPYPPALSSCESPVPPGRLP